MTEFQPVRTFDVIAGDGSIMARVETRPVGSSNEGDRVRDALREWYDEPVEIRERDATAQDIHEGICPACDGEFDTKIVENGDAAVSVNIHDEEPAFERVCFMPMGGENWVYYHLNDELRPF